VAELVQQHTQKYQKKKESGFQSSGNPALRAIKRSENRKQQEERDVYPNLNPGNPRNFDRPSHGSTYDALLVR
jgi:hypothetical protein